MLSSKTVQKFNEVRALIFAKSPQVQQSGEFLVTLDENKKIDCRVAHLACPESYDTIIRCIQKSPLSIELLETANHAIIRSRAAPHRPLAYMLT